MCVRVRESVLERVRLCVCLYLHAFFIIRKALMTFCKQVFEISRGFSTFAILLFAFLIHGCFLLNLPDKPGKGRDYYHR